MSSCQPRYVHLTAAGGVVPIDDDSGLGLDFLPILLPGLIANTLEHLKALVTRPACVGLAGRDAPGDGLGGVYFWSPGNLTPPDDEFVVAPTVDDPPGRWLAFGQYGRAMMDYPVAGNLTNRALAVVPHGVDGSGNAVPIGRVVKFTATIAAGATGLSDVIDLGNARLAAIQMPAAWVAAGLSVRSSADGVTFSNVFDSLGGEYQIAVDASQFVLVPISDFMAVQYLQLRSGTSGAPVDQTASRAITLLAAL